MQVTLLVLIIQLSLAGVGQSLFRAISFSRQLFIPGGYFSLMNFSQNIEPFRNYYDVSIDFALTQASYGDQGNSVYDYFIFGASQYSTIQPCYVSASSYLNEMYAQYEPCQGGCSFEADICTNQNSTYLDLTNYSMESNFSLVIDNSFYPCNGGSYQSQIYLYEMLNLTIETNLSYFFMLKVIFVVLLQIFIFLFAYIMIMISRLQNSKKKLKKLVQQREEKEDLEVMHTYKEEGR